MHEPCAHFAETDGADVKRGDIRTGRHPFFFRDAAGTVTTGMGGGHHKEITYSDVVFIPVPVCLSHLSCEIRNMEKTEGTTAR